MGRSRLSAASWLALAASIQAVMFKTLQAIGEAFIAPTASLSKTCDLAGVWTPVRHGAWYTRSPGRHSERASHPSTRMVYGEDGSGEGWVGEFFLYVSVTTLAPGEYSATVAIPSLKYMATDGRLSVNRGTGELEVRFPSNGIIEYWARTDGRALLILQEARLQHSVSNASSLGRWLHLLLRRIAVVGPIPYHWALQVGSNPGSIFELNGSMVVYGPTGVIAANSLIRIGPRKGTRLDQFDGVLSLMTFCTKSDKEIKEFSKLWIQSHPAYKPAGPNCQTFIADLYVFLTGESLPFSQIGDLKKGPEYDGRVHWMNKGKQPWIKLSAV